MKFQRLKLLAVPRAVLLKSYGTKNCACIYIFVFFMFTGSRWAGGNRYEWTQRRQPYAGQFTEKYLCEV